MSLLTSIFEEIFKFCVSLSKDNVIYFDVSISSGYFAQLCISSRELSSVIGSNCHQMDGKITSNSSGYRRANLKIAPGAVVCEESILKGDISIGAKTIIHPRACILAEAGPIIIGEGNIIEEMATIANRSPPDAPESATVPVQIIGNYNVFETDCTCESFKVGDNNILEAKAHVGREIELTNGCVIGAACSLTEREIVPENMIVYGSQNQRREMNDKPYPQIGQLDFLLKVLPNYHHFRKSNMKPKLGANNM